MNNVVIDSFLIENIDEQSFYFGGGIYLHKSVTDENLRQKQKEKDILDRQSVFVNGSALSDYNLLQMQNEFNSRSKSNDSSVLRNIFSRKKVEKETANPYEFDISSKRAEIERFTEDFITTDTVVLLSKSPLDGNNLYDEENFSIFVQKLENDVILGFMVDKFSAYVMFNRSVTYEQNI